MRRPTARSEGFPQRLQALVDRYGSIAGLAEASGVGGRTIGDWLRGVRMPHAAKIRKLCLALRISPDWLVNGEKTFGPDIVVPKGDGPAIISAGELGWGAPEPTRPTVQIEALDGRESLASVYGSWLASRHGINSEQRVVLLHALEDLPGGEILKDEPVLFHAVGQSVGQEPYRAIVGEIVLVVGEMRDHLWIEQVSQGKPPRGEIVGTAFWSGHTINRRRRPQ